MAQAKFRPIIFSTPMVQAILDGKKTQTRRVVKPQPKTSEMRWTGTRWEQYLGYPVGHDVPICPYGDLGDLLWVRETYLKDTHGFHSYWADYDPETQRTRNGVWVDREAGIKAGMYWKVPSIFMPRAHARITLKITQARIERLQDIDEEDAWEEGVQTRDDFIKLWDSIHPKGEYIWERNPWVWAIEFKVEKTT